MSKLSTEEARIRRALRQSLVAIAILGVAGGAVFLATRHIEPDETVEEADVAGPALPSRGAVEPPVIAFTDITDQAGIRFVHENGAYGERLLPETMGGGVAFLDYDGDGNQDLLFINSDHWPWRPAAPSATTSRLYRNLGDGMFDDVSAVAGLALTLYGMGGAVGDYDGDGHLDVYITALGANRLMRNVGGSFVDVTDAAGVAGGTDAWSTGAAFFDYDRDGDLDLFVCNYVRWSPEIDREVDYRLTGVGRAYGPPTDFPGVDSYLFRNDGSRFTDVSAESGIQVANPATGVPIGKALAVLPVDVNRDGWPDIAIANDTVRNFLFLNQANGSFREAGVELGLAFDPAGLATGAMGIDAAHFANDDRLAIAIGNFANEMTSFYVSHAGTDLFSDDAIVAGVGAESRRALTFGLLFLDADLDGRVDLLAANGHVEPAIARVQASQSYAQPVQLFWNCGAGCTRPFHLVADALETPLVARGAAYADIDGDGDLDLALTQAGGPAVLLRNDQRLGHHWLRIRLRASPPNVHAIGARVTLEASGARQHRTMMPTRSYLSQVEPMITFGLGASEQVDSVTVTWPDGETESWTDLELNRVHILQRGTAK
ncbi:MAG: CRTAC1 family protein [Gammaproteobacteria bacterium]|nr:CRTAC1 family protein [Gammaproteobacteria bacterium]